MPTNIIDTAPEMGISAVVIVLLFVVVLWLLKQSRSDNMRTQIRADEAWGRAENATDTFISYVQSTSSVQTEALQAAAEGFRAVNKTMEIFGNNMMRAEERANKRHEEVMDAIRQNQGG